MPLAVPIDAPPLMPRSWFTVVCVHTGRNAPVRFWMMIPAPLVPLPRATGRAAGPVLAVAVAGLE